jgi:Ca2+-binding EF-hand superfamily protein
MTTSILGVTLEKPRFFFATKVSESFAHGATTATTAAAAAATKHHDTTATTEPTIRSMWRRRNARSAEEGIRREKTSQPEQVVRQKKTSQLSSLLAKVRSLETKSKQYAARTISGLINALAEEVDDLDVQVDARRDTPMSGKHVDAIRIKFSRLVFKPLRMGGLDHAFSGVDEVTDGMGVDTITRQLADLSCADEAFQRIDVDRSGALDPDEIATALNLAAGSTDQIDERKNNVIKDLASQLVQLYDFNGDGVVDRSEYQSMVEDMAALRKKTKKEKDIKSIDTAAGQEQSDGDEGWLASTKHWVLGFFQRNSEDMAVEDTEQKNVVIGVADNGLADTADESDAILDVSDSVQVMDTMAKTLGSITLSDLKIDLRRLIFGAVPILKHITPGGPLILEPFTTTVTGSFSREDMLNSFLLDAGLRRLVARALRRRVRSFRDLIDGAVFFGRSWKMTSASAPVVEIPQIENIEFDDDNRLIITGRAQVQTRSDAPQIENAFKVRTRIGTRKGGRTIKLIEPELAFILECPESWEKK